MMNPRIVAAMLFVCFLLMGYIVHAWGQHKYIQGQQVSFDKWAEMLEANLKKPNTPATMGDIKIPPLFKLKPDYEYPGYGPYEPPLVPVNYIDVELCEGGIHGRASLTMAHR